MKRIFIILTIFLSFFLFNGVVSATSLDDYNVEIILDEESDGIIIKEKFKTNFDELEGTVLFEKNFPRYAKLIDTNTGLILPETGFYDDNVTSFELENNTEYFINYEFKNNLPYGVKYKVDYKPVEFSGIPQLYNKFSFSIVTSENDPLTLSDISNNMYNDEDFTLGKDENIITGYYSNEEEPLDDTIIISFMKTSHRKKTAIETALDYTLSVLRILVVVMIVLSLCKIITKNNVYNKVILTLMFVSIGIYVLSTIASAISYGPDGVISLGMFLFILAFYSLFYYAAFFSGPQVPVMGLFIKLFVIFHSYVFVIVSTGFTNPATMDSMDNMFNINTMINHPYLTCAFIVLIASYGYTLFNEKYKKVRAEDDNIPVWKN